MGQILLLVTYTAKPGLRERFVEEIRSAGLRETIAREEGCLRYEYVYPVEEEGTLLLIECWETEAHQMRHLSQPHMARLRAIKERYIAQTKVERFAAADSAAGGGSIDKNAGL